MRDTEMLIRTDKAELYMMSESTLLKQYRTENARARVEQDVNSLEYLNRHFGEIGFRGWRYSIVRLLSKTEDEEGIVMEFVEGRTLSSVSRAEANQAEYQCGLWMALYHNKMIPGGHEGLVYTDLNVHNVMIDSGRKTVTVLDPGMTWGRIGITYEDLIKHVNSTLFVLVLRGRFPVSSISYFLKGYCCAAVSKFRFRTYYRGLFSELRRELEDHSRRSLVRGALFGTSVVLLSPLYVLIVPFYMHANNGKKGNGGEMS